MTVKERKPYRKPGIQQVKLVSKQSVLTTCKDGAGAEATCKLAGDPLCAGSDARS